MLYGGENVYFVRHLNYTMADETRYELTKSDYRRNNLLLYGAPLSPALLALPPAALFFVFFLLSSTTATAALYFFLALVSLGAGFLLGIVLMIALLIYRQSWLKNLREKLAIDGVKTHEVEWFKNELTTAERKTLKEMERQNLLLADAYRETLASRLTATRILKSSKNELMLVQRRQNKLKYLKSDNTKALQEELDNDRQRLETVKNEAESLLGEAKTRLETIEAAARRGTALTGNEQALKLLSERSQQLPLALEAAKIEEELRRELEKETMK